MSRWGKDFLLTEEGYMILFTYRGLNLYGDVNGSERATLSQSSPLKKSGIFKQRIALPF